MPAGQWTVLHGEVLMQRLVGYYVANTYVPTTLLGKVQCCVFE